MLKKYENEVVPRGEEDMVFRMRIYFLYRSNTLANEIMKDPFMPKLIN